MISPFDSHSTALKAIVRFLDGVKASSANGSSNQQSLPLALPRCFKHSRSGLLVAIAKSTGTSRYHSVSEPRVQRMKSSSTEVHFRLRFSRVTGKIKEPLGQSVSTLFRGILEEHSLHVINVSRIFLHPFASFFFLSTLKGNTKIWLCTGGRRRRASRVSQFSFWEFFFYRRLCPSRSNPPVVNCAPIPKMVPHSLNEQKCIGELVRAGCECL